MERVALSLVKVFFFLSPFLAIIIPSEKTYASNSISLSVSAANVSCNGLSNGSIVSTLSGGSGGTVNYTLTPGPVTNTSGIFTNLAVGSYTIVANDGGITAEANITIIVDDIIPPTINCTNLTVATPADIPSANLHTGVTASDNCGSATIELVRESYDGLDRVAGFCPEKVVRIYRARDQNGNISSDCTQEITIQGFGTCKVCQDNVPFIPVIFSRPDETFLSREIVRDGLCCNASNPSKCISFNIYLHKDAVGLIFNFASGAIPAGSLYYQIDCGPQHKVGEVLCLQGGQFYTITFCEPGGNKNTYSIRSISGITAPEGLVTRADDNCTGQITVSGIESSSISWSVKSPADQSLLHYLSCTNCLTPIFTPDAAAPASVIYTVCGTMLGTAVCNGSPIVDCNDVAVTVLQTINITLDVDPGNMCPNTTIHPIVTPANLTYTYKWYNGLNGSGSVISTNSSWTPTLPGAYSLIATETETGAICNTATKNFTVGFDKTPPVFTFCPPGKTIYTDPNRCYASGVILGLATATDNCSTPIITNNAPLIFPTGVNIVTWTATDALGNTAICTQSITVLEIEPPSLIAPAPFNFCVENLISASMVYNLLQLNPDPDYSLFKKGSNTLDLDPTGFSDNCTPANQLVIHWKIDFGGIAPPPSITGIGQPSTYSGDIHLPGDGVAFQDVTHTITYWVVDLAGNESVHKAVTITIHPRPVVSYFNQEILEDSVATNIKT